ncbi:hypothetical protein Nepgr_019354 [Nepenthes gracilis]|uniref:Protein BZR1 homolog n=1 Tax=Nepenthes gracilis TaxID=150966 RepID=A0AAD3STW0_NEPGR|nr:hypothetical protein Nepgr_019354 [Nepenthes gracilis]
MVKEDGVTSARRKPSWRERENNRRRERRRRAIAANIFAGLRAQGNYNLPKHCDNNEVLKTLCAEAGWIVEPDGTTYRKGCKPPQVDLMGAFVEASACSSQMPSPVSSAFPSPIPSYQLTPSSSALLSPMCNDIIASFHPFSFLSDSIPSHLPPLRISNSAPVTPLLSSPTSRSALKQNLNFESVAIESMAALNHSVFAESAPSSPTHYWNTTPPHVTECNFSGSSTIDSSQWISFNGFARPHIPTSPTSNLVNHMVQKRMPDDSIEERARVAEPENVTMKPWEGERIQDVAMDDLELTLGSRKAQT